MDSAFDWLAYFVAGSLVGGLWRHMYPEAHDETPFIAFVVPLWPIVQPYMASDALVRWLRK